MINIHRQDEVIVLDAGRYAIDVLGGWGVKLRDFSVRLMNVDNGEIVTSKRSLWPRQSYAFGKRRKRILTFEVRQPGVYRVEFINPNSIEVTHSNLFFVTQLTKPIANAEVAVYIH